jgi:AcrR family transcriptional regulator
MSNASQRLTPRGTVTRARIVDAATDLVETRGLSDTSLDAVLARSRASKSQLYHYFADRDDLVLAVVARKIEIVLDVNGPLLSELSTLAQLRHWRDALVAQAREVDCAGGCPLGSLVGELGRSRRARAAIAEGFASWRGLFVRGFSRMKRNGQLRPSARPKALASATLAALQGGLLLSQVERSSKPLEAALDMAIANVRRHAAA